VRMNDNCENERKKKLFYQREESMKVYGGKVSCVSFKRQYRFPSVDETEVDNISLGYRSGLDRLFSANHKFI